uniref:Uncharacterized protein n=1 Tax=viral metagenome TaxID=1070528 RepID=A0A6C0JFB5_9ZZZZ
MAINSLGKNSIGVILALLLVILLSESRLFNFFTDTYLGRAFLIIILLFASYLHKILGVVCVFIIIIMFNNNNSSYYEGFDGTTSNSNVVGDKVEKAKNAVSQAANAQNSTTSTPTSTTTSTPTSITTTTDPTTTTGLQNNKIDVITSALNNSSNNSGATNSTTTASPSIEGFDLQSTENNIKRGKQSNSIPVNQFLMQSPQVAPYESANFSENFGVL